MTKRVWWTPTEEESAWLQAKYTYEPDTGIIRERASGEERGHVHASGRRVVQVQNVAMGLKRVLYAHRLAWLLHYGRWPDRDIDHRDLDPLNNRIDNLRVVTQSQNMQNTVKQRTFCGRTCSSRYKGVNLKRERKTNPWGAHITVNGKQFFLGYFASEEEAAAAYRAAALQHFGEHAAVA